MKLKTLWKAFFVVGLCLIFFQSAIAGSRPYPAGYDPKYIPPDSLSKSIRTLSVPTSLTPPFFDNVEGGTNGWTATGFWHIVTNPQNIQIADIIHTKLVNLPDQGYLPQCYSGTSCWWYGEDTTGTFIGSDFDQNQAENSGGTSISSNTSSLVSPSINLAGMQKATLSFSTWWEIEGVDVDRFDMMHVEVSTDDGATYNTISSLNPLNDVNSASNIGYSTGGVNAPGVWGQVYFDLSGYVNNTIRVRFRFETIDAYYNGFRGWFIDDIRVSSLSAPLLGISSVQPAVTKIGDIVSVNGSGFVLGGTTVKIGGTAGQVVVIFHNKILVYVPELANGQYNVTVTNPDGNTATLTNGLTISDLTPPVIASISPHTAESSALADIVISGSGFAAGATASISGTPLQNVTVVNATTITASVPANLAAGNKNIFVVNPDGLQGQCYSCFEVTEPPVPVCQNTITKPYTFVSGTPAKAQEVNANLDLLYQQINLLSCEINALKAIICQDHPGMAFCR